MLAQVSCCRGACSANRGIAFLPGVHETSHGIAACVLARVLYMLAMLSPHLLPASMRVPILAFMSAAIAYVATSRKMWLPLRYSRFSKQPHPGFWPPFQVRTMCNACNCLRGKWCSQVHAASNGTPVFAGLWAIFKRFRHALSRLVPFP